MTSAGLRGLRQDLDQLFREGSLAGASDAQLLERFVAEGDAAAFEALVARHRDMVLRTCHDLLGNAAEAEEAFQATALILLRRAGSVREQDAVGAWLHRVACRVARRSRTQSVRRRAGEAQAVAARGGQIVASAEPDPLVRDELRSALHGEIDRLPDRYRRPVVLCLLEGMPQEEAAARLGWSEGSVRGRLARGRARLRDRLTRRGISLAAIVAALGEPETVSAAVRPFATLLRTRSAIAVSSALVAVGAVWLAIAVQANDPPKPPARAAVAPAAPLPALAPAPAPEPERAVLASFRGGGPTNESRLAGLPPDIAASSVAFVGQVLDPAGKGVAGARLSLVTDAWSVPEPQAVSGDDGTFRFKKTVGDFWRNFAPGGVATPQVQAVVLATHDAFGAAWVDLRVVAKDGKPAFGDEYPLTLKMVADRPIEGRILDTDGNPVARASVRVDQLYAVPRGDLSPILDALRQFDLAPYQRTYPRIWPNNLAAAQVFPPVTTGADGRFTLKGVGRDRHVNLSVSGPGVAPASWTVLNRDDANEVTQAVRTRWPRAAGKGAPGVAVYGPAFELRVDPTPTIHGTVRDGKTGQPLPGAMVLYGAAPATTDDQGQYRIVRGDQGDQLRLNVHPPRDEPFLGISRAFEHVPPTGELTADFTLPRALIVSGRVVERGSGKPMLATRSHGCHGPGPMMAGRVWYQPLPGNVALKDTEAGAFFRHALTDWHGLFVGLIGADGEYKGAIPPGPGVLLVEALPGTPFMWEYSSPSKESDGMHRRFPYAHLTQRDADDGAPRGPGDAKDKLAGLFGPIALEGFVAYRVIAPAADDEAFDALIRIPTAPTRRVRFVDPSDQPVRGATVIGVTVMEHPVVLEGDEVELLALDAPASRRVAALSADGRFWAEATVRADSREVLTVRMHPSSSVIGRLVDERGKPIEGASVSAQYLPDEPALLPMVLSQGPTDADGRFRVNGIVPNHPIQIDFSRRGKTPFDIQFYRPDSLRKVVPDAGRTRDLGTVTAKSSTG